MMKTTTDAVQILHAIVGDDPKMRSMVEEEREKQRVASLIYEARTAAGLTQAELAARVGTRQSAIARLEDADYEGHILTVLERIARATGLPGVRQTGPSLERGRSSRQAAEATGVITSAATRMVGTRPDKRVEA